MYVSPSHPHRRHRHRSDVTARSCPQPRRCWSWTRWQCVGERRAERAERRKESPGQTHARKKQTERIVTLAFHLRVWGSSSVPRENDPLPPPSPVSLLATAGFSIPIPSHSESSPGWTLHRLALLRKLLKEAGLCTKAAHKKCHCCVLEVREELTVHVLTRLAVHFLHLL